MTGGGGEIGGSDCVTTTLKLLFAEFAPIASGISTIAVDVAGIAKLLNDRRADADARRSAARRRPCRR